MHYIIPTGLLLLFHYLTIITISTSLSPFINFTIILIFTAMRAYRCYLKEFTCCLLYPTVLIILTFIYFKSILLSHFHHSFSLPSPVEFNPKLITFPHYTSFTCLQSGLPLYFRKISASFLSLLIYSIKANVVLCFNVSIMSLKQFITKAKTKLDAGNEVMD